MSSEEVYTNMPIKVKIVRSKPETVSVRIKRAPWQQFLHY